ncbi:MAG: DEAD/DEAH box helicase [Planctomycetaceae bacterium]|jgi:non-specific serine/threonine protein kinase|nr:DEAD/DEAH box helicase [Planctomycetaceae bacterium]
MFPQIHISPAGHPYLDEPEIFNQSDQSDQSDKLNKNVEKTISALENRLRNAFNGDLDYPKGLLSLATTELETALPSDFDFLRSFAKNYLTRLCHLPELGNVGDKAMPELATEASSTVQQSAVPVSTVPLPTVPLPTVSEMEFFLINAPPMPGAEYLTSEVLTEWWKELDRFVHKKIEQHPAGAADWIQRQNPLWRTVGRVTFHLAENKRDEVRPFAFMATYTDKVSAGAKPIQLPLSKALTEYASVQDRGALLRLLQPITAAAEKCIWVQNMVEDQTIYQPRAWTPQQAHQLLQDIPSLEESGLIVRVPDWWKSRQHSRPQVRVNIGTKKETSILNITSLLNFRVNTVLNGETLTEEELNELLNADGSLVRLRGQWVEVDREKLQAALDHWQKIDDLVQKEGLSFYEGMRLLSGLPVDGKWDALDQETIFRDWSEVMPIGSFAETLAAIRNPDQCEDFSFHQIGLNATLRPYQEIGVHWLHLMSRLGLGACLADDMGLGKTIQVITLLLSFKKNPKFKRPTDSSSRLTTSLLVAPASLLGNWESEIQKFAPDLKPRIAHSSGSGTEEPKNWHEIDLVMTTYGMVERLNWIQSKRWSTIILDEAQAIKNAGTKQAKAVKKLNAGSRIVLTGTPIENRLSDLWSLFDFLNPGLLGSSKGFAAFVKSLSTKNSATNYAPLRKLTQPYILRRLKTDKRIISDLPDKTEITAWCGLGKKQAVLYSQSVEQLAKDLKENHEGIKRRGIILSYLLRFKQICNHPAQWTGDGDYNPALSGKFERLKEICDEIASRQEKVLVFTQFREMTEPIAFHLQNVFHRTGLVLDGTTAIKKRREMVEAFQSESGAPFFVLSLKAGGTGLNLTAASHVIHFDRWWNPAVENQATDRAFRIGQRKNVLVHKFVCRGTVEERIEEMIESKKSLARELIEGGGEALVTEMNDEQLLKMVALDINRSQEI